MNPFDKPGVGRDPAWRGPDRRKGQERRQQRDRREEFRFEPDKDDRRKGRDRRAQEPWDGNLRR